MSQQTTTRVKRIDTYTSQGTNTNIVRMLSGQTRRINDDDDDIMRVEDIDDEFEVKFQAELRQESTVATLEEVLVKEAIDVKSKDCIS
jgi:hypothetical protein